MNEIFAALYARLTAQLAIGVYDHVPQDNTDYPFVRINPIRTTNDDRVSEDGFEAIVEIIAFSRYRGLNEINGICDNIYSALHNWDMSDTATYSVGTFKELSREIINDPDGLTRNSVQLYRFFYETT